MDVFSRYEEQQVILSKLDPFDDLVALLRGLTSVEYFADQARRHPIIGKPKDVAREASSYIHVSLDYLDQARNGPYSVAFLPLYYAVLNLLKVYVALGPHRAQLPAQPLHGASYDPHGKESHSLLSERIALHSRGVIPLFYQTATGAVLVAKKRLMAMADVYPFISGLGAEYGLATGRQSRLLSVRFDLDYSGKSYTPRVHLPQGVGAGPSMLREMKVVLGFSASGGDTLRGTPVDRDDPIRDQKLRAQIRPVLLYLQETTPPKRTHGTPALTPLNSGHILLLEELPIALALFHLSSVARYRPGFLDRLWNSRFQTS